MHNNSDILIFSYDQLMNIEIIKDYKQLKPLLEGITQSITLDCSAHYLFFFFFSIRIVFRLRFIRSYYLFLYDKRKSRQLAPLV